MDRRTRCAAAGIILLLVTGQSAANSLDQAYSQFLKGNYGEALETYAALKEADPGSVALGRARCERAVGHLHEAEKILHDALAHKESADLQSELADLHFYRGKWDVASELVAKALKLSPEHPPAHWVKAQLAMAKGDTPTVEAELEWFLAYYNNQQPTEPENLILVAQAATEHARRHKMHDQFDFIVNQLLPDAAAANPLYWRAPYTAGMLFLEKYNRTEGVPELRNALQTNPSSSETLVGLGTASLQDFDFPAATNFADQALAVNPRSVEGYCLKADILLADTRTAAALSELEKAFAINPVSEAVLGRMAACYSLLREKEKTEQLEKEVRSRNPKPGQFYYLWADALENRRQFPEAEKRFGQALEASPWLAGAMNGLGMLYMRIGKEEEARRMFTTARDFDPFHVRVANMTKVLKHLEDYKPVESEHYLVYVDEKKDKLLGRYLSEYMESVHPILCKRFGYEPRQKTKIEVMIDHAWFSARVVGLPSIGTVGACTGDVVALASPRSLRSPYNWARVITHEVTHILTLQQTLYNIPHWYTEALAVLSEGYPRPQVWNELLAERVPKNDLFNLDNINHAFVRPKTPLDWQMAYCQSLLYAQYMQERFGEDALARLLNAYRDGLETDKAIPAVFKVAKEDFEKGYREYLNKVVKGLSSKPTAKKLSFAEAERAYRDDPQNADKAADLAMHYYRRKSNVTARELANKALALKKNHPVALALLANLELSIGKIDDALRIAEPGLDPDNPNESLLELLATIRVRQKNYTEAARLYEMARKQDPLSQKWLEGLARVYLLAKNEEKLPTVLEQLASMDSDNKTVRLKLAELASQRKDWEAVEKWSRETVFVDVAEVRAHRLWAEAATARDRHAIAAREWDAVHELEPADEKATLNLAESLHAAGDHKKAIATLRELVAKNPANAEAKSKLAGWEK